jgi:hypothetical protein
MKALRAVAKWSMLLLMLVVAACASASSGETGAGESGATGEGATIVVINEQVAAPLLQLYIEPVGGVRANLGRVEPNATGTFRYNGPTGQYVIVAQNVAAGTTLISDRFTVRPGRTITWHLVSRRITFRDGS